MREYLFRGKDKRDNRLVFGDLIVSDGKYYIHPQSNRVTVNSDVGKMIVMHEVDPDTVGQYIGLRDKNGVRIFEGDILEVDLYPYACLSEHICLAQVAWREYESAFGLYIFKDMTPKNNGIEIGKCVDMDEDESANYEVIGNIHDNKDLLEV